MATDEAPDNLTLQLAMEAERPGIEACLQNNDGPGIRVLTIRLVHRHGTDIWKYLRDQPCWSDCFPWWEQQLNLQNWTTAAQAVQHRNPVAQPPIGREATTAIDSQEHEPGDEGQPDPGTVGSLPGLGDVTSELEESADTVCRDLEQLHSRNDELPTVTDWPGTAEGEDAETTPAPMTSLDDELVAPEEAALGLEESASVLLRNLQELPHSRLPMVVAGEDPGEGETAAATDAQQHSTRPGQLRGWLPQTLLPHQWRAVS